MQDYDRHGYGKAKTCERGQQVCEERAAFPNPDGVPHKADHENHGTDANQQKRRAPQSGGRGCPPFSPALSRPL
ncbi:hypothetical protein GCM10011574_27320 [Microbispora bryophytorum]|uniref:Uncharacterized protein n=1 Tax=Microbispora bryophytorum TaxID=1460882 RepID=A0A8H9H337_9ACTN|nr:hypothetical protein GCM10011574_27320 [Microbispora bryophytorum]